MHGRQTDATHGSAAIRCRRSAGRCAAHSPGLLLAGGGGSIAGLPAGLGSGNVQRPGSCHTRAHPSDVAGCRLCLQGGVLGRDMGGCWLAQAAAELHAVLGVRWPGERRFGFALELVSRIAAALMNASGI